MIKKKDILLATIAGFFTALFLLPTLKNVKLLGISNIPYILMVGLPLAWILVLTIGRFLSRWFGFMSQFSRFVVMGFLNTAIDFGVLNLISLYTGLTSGFIIGGVNVPGFIIGATNSYFWNKFWVFAKERKSGEKVDYSDIFRFSMIIISSVILNGTIVVLVSTYVHPFFGFSAARWLNIAKVIATAISLFWNFIGLKFFVFKAKDMSPDWRRENK